MSWVQAHRKTTYGDPLSPATLFIKSFLFYKLYFEKEIKIMSEEKKHVEYGKTNSSKKIEDAVQEEVQKEKSQASKAADLFFKPVIFITKKIANKLGIENDLMKVQTIASFILVVYVFIVGTFLMGFMEGANIAHNYEYELPGRIITSFSTNKNAANKEYSKGKYYDIHDAYIAAPATINKNGVCTAILSDKGIERYFNDRDYKRLDYSVIIHAETKDEEAVMHRLLSDQEGHINSLKVRYEGMSKDGTPMFFIMENQENPSSLAKVGSLIYYLLDYVTQLHTLIIIFTVCMITIYSKKKKAEKAANEMKK